MIPKARKPDFPIALRGGFLRLFTLCSPCRGYDARVRQQPEDFEPRRLKPEMASQRLLVLDFVRDYLTRWGASPSHGEIAAGLSIHPDRVRRAIRKLVRDGMLVRRAGPRGLSLPEAEAEAIRQLRGRVGRSIRRRAAP